MKLILKLIVKDQVVTEKPYKQNLRTGPDFLIVDPKVFETEKTRLINYLNKTTELGANHFEGKVSHSFGPLSSTEWNNMFYKHLDHHLNQFGV
jgi:SRSO17 transposase